MILAVIAVRTLALNRLPKKIFVLLWAVVLMRLLIPFSIPSVLSAYSFVERNETIQEPLANTPVNYMLPRTTEGQINMNTVTTQSSQSNESGFPIRQVVWIAGMILCAAAALCVHWFNPAVWAMYILFNRDIELYCDESVVRQFGDDSKVSYAKALITMEEKRRGLPSLGNNFSKNAIEKRITAIMKTRKRTGSQIDSEETADGGMAEGETEVERTEEGRTEGDEAVAEGTVDGERETEQTTTAGITMQGNDVPDVVLDAAKQYVAVRFQGGRRERN